MPICLCSGTLQSNKLTIIIIIIINIVHIDIKLIYYNFVISVDIAVNVTSQTDDKLLFDSDCVIIIQFIVQTSYLQLLFCLLFITYYNILYTYVGAKSIRVYMSENWSKFKTS